MRSSFRGTFSPAAGFAPATGAPAVVHTPVYDTDYSAWARPLAAVVLALAFLGAIAYSVSTIAGSTKWGNVNADTKELYSKEMSIKVDIAKEETVRNKDTVTANVEVANANKIAEVARAQAATDASATRQAQLERDLVALRRPTVVVYPPSATTSIRYTGRSCPRKDGSTGREGYGPGGGLGCWRF